MNALAIAFSKGFVARAKRTRRAETIGHSSVLAARGTTRLSYVLSVHDTHGEHEDSSHKWFSAFPSETNEMKQGATSWKQ